MLSVDEIRRLIAEAETEAAIELLLQATRAYSKKLQDEAILLSARFEEWRKDERMGMVENESELNKINAAVLELAHSIAEPVPETPKPRVEPTPKKARTRIGLLVISLLGLALLAIVIAKWGSGILSKGSMVKNSTTENEEKRAIFNVESSMDNWFCNIQPFGAKCQMTIREITTEAKNPTTAYLKIKLAAKNVHEGWYPVQLTSSLFLLETDGDAIQTESDLLVTSVDPGETKVIELIFPFLTTAKNMQLIIKESEGKQTAIPLHIK